MEQKIFKKINFYLLGIFIISFMLFYPSLFNFFSHDDFFHLKISQVNKIGDFLNFFNLLHAPEGFGFYRPLTTQVFYALGIYIFNLNPLPLHIIAFLVFFGVIFLVFNLTKLLIKSNQAALMAAFLYATSATHFGHLYFLGAFQELGLAFFFLLSVISFALFLKERGTKYYVFCMLAFVAALMSKESAVTILPVFGLVFIYFRLQQFTKLSFKEFVIKTIPFAIILVIYLYLHIFHYGLAQGDSYIWDFSPRVFNTIFWYGLWSFGIPEMLVDFIGPGLNVNPNLMKYYTREILPILILFVLLLVPICLSVKNIFKKPNVNDIQVIILSALWFLVSLSPVMFLPWHKFTYELSVPLFGIALLLSYFVTKAHQLLRIWFLIVYLFLSIFTIFLTYKTHWIVQGGLAARSVFNEINDRLNEKTTNITFVFYDQEQDNELPWKPSLVLKQTLSDNNFFEVFYEGRAKGLYGVKTTDGKDIINFPAREFLNY